MNALIGLLLLATLIGLAVGLINPPWVRLESRARVAIIFGLVFLGFSFLAALTSPSSSDTQTDILTHNPAIAVSSTTTAIASTSQTTSAPQTDQQRLESIVRSQLGGTGIQVTFKGVNIDEDDPVRPANSNFVTIDLNLGDFWDKNELTNESGTMVANIIQQVYSINPHFYDVLVMFYGPTKDEYGNSKDAPILSYGTDRPEEERINWSGFDKTTLCSLLNRDASVRDDAYLGCHYLVNIQ